MSTTSPNKDVLLKDYEIKVNYLKDHLGRMWTRFNIFLTLQTGLAGAKIIYEKDKTQGIDERLLYLALLLAVIWCIVGIIDSSLVRNYRDQIKLVFNKLRVALNDPTFSDIPFTGEVEEAKMNILERMLRKLFSPTKLIFTVPLILIVILMYLLRTIQQPALQG